MGCIPGNSSPGGHRKAQASRGLSVVSANPTTARVPASTHDQDYIGISDIIFDRVSVIYSV